MAPRFSNMNDSFNRCRVESVIWIRPATPWDSIRLAVLTTSPHKSLWIPKTYTGYGTYTAQPYAGPHRYKIRVLGDKAYGACEGPNGRMDRSLYGEGLITQYR